MVMWVGWTEMLVCEKVSEWGSGGVREGKWGERVLTSVLCISRSPWVTCFQVFFWFYFISKSPGRPQSCCPRPRPFQWHSVGHLGHSAAGLCLRCSRLLCLQAQDRRLPLPILQGMTGSSQKHTHTHTHLKNVKYILHYCKSWNKQI